MSALDGFYTTWARARATFGDGTPKDGAEYDGSARLRQFQAAIEAAAPDDRWQGTAADAYAAKNREHAAVYGKLADLDQRMATEVDRSAAVVMAGRRNLDEVQAWVTDVAASIPPGQSAEQMRMVLANKGIGQISEIIGQSTGEMSSIGGRIRELGKEYEAIEGPGGYGTSAGGY